MNLSLTKKILLVVAIPFAIQLVFLGVMSQKLKKLSDAQVEEQRLAKVMMAGDLYFIGEGQATLLATIYMATRDENCKQRAFQVGDDLVRVFNELAELWKDDPEKLKILNVTYADHENTTRLGRQLIFTAFAPKETVGELFGGPYLHALIRASIHRKDFRSTPLRPVFEREIIAKQEKAAVLLTEEQEIYATLAMGILATVIASISSGVWFSTSISRRLKVVLANIGALVDSSSQLQTVKGRDEISNLNASVVMTANKIRDVKDFQAQTIAIMAEELNTPLTEVDTALAELKEHGFEDISEKGAQRLQGASREVSRLKLLVSELVNLDIAGRALAIAEIDIRELATNCAKIVEPLAKSKNLTIVHNVPDATIVFGDHDKIMQVLLNLLSNAIKYSPENAVIEIVVALEEKQVRVSVVDQGQGIPDEFHSRIFQRFEQAESGQTVKPASSGLGLVISKEIVESQAGQMGFTSEFGSGSTFWFTLPKSRQSEVKPEFENSKTASVGWKPTLWKKAILVVAIPMVVQGITIAALWKFLQENSEKIAQFEKIPKITAVHAQLMDAVTHAGFFSMLYNLDKDSQSLKLAKAEKRKLIEKIDELEKITATKQGADKLTADLIKSVRAHIALDDRLINAAPNVNVSSWFGSKAANKKESLYIDTQAPLQALIRQEYQLMASTAKESEDIRRNFELLLIASALTTSLLSAALGLSIVKSLTRRAREISTTALEFSDQRLLTKPTPGTDELAFVEKRLYEAEKKLMELEVSRAEMIGITSHELRTPLTSLMALTDLIENGVFGAINERGKLLLTKARLRIGELIVLITNLLDLEKMESGKILVTKKPILVENVFEDVKIDTVKLAQDKGINLVINPCNIEVDADSRRISQSLIAVIQSIIRRVPTLSEVHMEGKQTEDAVVISMSAPHGIAVKGFNNKNKEFAREKMAVSLARLTAQQHGGKFTVSTFNRGRTMTMSLPLKTSG